MMCAWRTDFRSPRAASPRFRIGPQMTSYDLAARIHLLLNQINQSNSPQTKETESDDDCNG